MKRILTFNDFITSSTAKAKKIDNTPTDIAIINNIHKTLQFLNNLDWSEDISINSGYRCKELNKAVGGVETSHHLTGFAADITSSNLTGLLALLKGKINEIDQLIYYKKRNFIHISIHPRNRKQYLVK